MTTILLQGMSRALWVATWADWNDEYRMVRVPPGTALMDLAPETPVFATYMAATLLGAILQASGLPLCPKLLLHRMAEAERIPYQEILAGEHDHLVELLGYYMAMEALGHGVSWRDDNQPFEIVIPGLECQLENFFPNWVDTPYYAQENNAT